MPRLSIITVCYNAADCIERTLRSVATLEFRDYEYLVIDGASSDATLDIVSRHAPPGTRVVSGRDAGIYDAMNKGMGLAGGEYLWFLNAGDTVADGSFLGRLAWDADFYYGGVIIRAGERVVKRSLPPAYFPAWRSAFGQIACHQSMIARKAASPPYDLRYRLVADMDWSIRILRRPGLRKVRVGACMVDYELDGRSTRNAERCWDERSALVAEHFGAWTRPLSRALRYWWRLKERAKSLVRP